VTRQLPRPAPEPVDLRRLSILPGSSPQRE
jgi:hypothetical protein